MKRLGHTQRRMVRQHDAARPDTQPRRCRRDVLDQDLGRRAGDARHSVMLSKPVTQIAETLGVLRKIDSLLERIASGGRGAHGYQVED